jgi:hypothetical protein
VSEELALLKQGRVVLAARLHASVDLSYPARCTAEAAWKALRGAISQNDYYFSVHELQIFLFVGGIGIVIHEFNETECDVTALEHIQTLPFYGTLEATDLIKIVRDARGDPDGLHGGHFSRLWSKGKCLDVFQGCDITFCFIKLVDNDADTTHK